MNTYDEDQEELSPCENFNLITPGVYRSAFPKKKNFSFLKKLKLKSILTLILEDYPDQNKVFLKENNIKLFQFGVAGNKEPFVDIPEDKISKALTVILDSDVVSCVGWTSNNELYSISDDKKINRWSGDGDLLGLVTKFDPSSKANESANVCATQLQWLPSAPGKGQTIADMFVVGGTDDKVVEAHKGAILSLSWNYEGSALVTGGEDGHIKIWSRSGMLRSTLAKTSFPIYGIVWSSDNEQCLYTNGKNLVIKSLQPANKPNQWKAHEGLVLQVDWNLVNNLIVSCGEDKKYKVWDTYGRKIYSSSPFEHPVTSISWCPSGDMFAIGSFNIVGVCDKLGWCYDLESVESGSIFNIAWTPDGTQIGCAGGNGAVLFGHLINRRYDWKQFQVTILDDHKLTLHDTIQGSTENMEFRDRVIKVCIGFGYLVVATSFQCYIYNQKNWNTPVIIDMSNNGRVTCIQQSLGYFVLVDSFVGIQIYTYDGRLISQPKYAGMRGEFMTLQTISLSNDVLAVKDHNDEKNIYLFDVASGRLIGDGPIKHTMDVIEIAINKANSGAGRQLVVVDKNRDMYITKVMKPLFQKLGTMVETFMWNDETDLLIAIMDGKLTLWYYPNAIFVDDDIAPLARQEKDGSAYGKNAQFVSFIGSNCTLRRADGALLAVSGVTPFAGLLQEFAKKKQWEEAIKLCRHVKLKELWASLAAMALNHQDLNTAEVAYAAIDEIHKVKYVCYIRDIPSAEGRAAELAMLRKQPKEAEGILLSANLIYRCIRMWIDLYNWDRALELAVKYKTHVDTVLHFRSRYLKALGRLEENKKFLQYSQSVAVEWPKIKAKIAMEMEDALFQYEAHRLGLVDESLEIVSERDKDLSIQIIVEEEEILEKYLSKHKIEGENDVLFIKETYFGCVRNAKLLDFVKEKIIEPLIQHFSMAQQLSHDLRKIVIHGETFETPKKFTEPQPFLLTDPKPRKLPLPTDKIPRTIKKLFNHAQKNQFDVAKPAPTRIREKLAQESIEKYEKTRVRNANNGQRHLNHSIPVKLTTAAILREEVLLRKKMKQQEIALAEAEMGLRDVAEFEHWKEELKHKEEEELLMHQEKKRLEIQLLHEEAVLARIEKLKENKDKAASVIQAKEEIKALNQELKKELEEENRKKIDEVKQIKEAAIKAKQISSKEKLKKAAQLSKEKKQLQEDAQRRANEERARKSQLIQQIRMLEKKGNTFSREVDLSETSGYGLLGEMSIVELQERVAQAKVKERAMADQKRKEIAETKMKKAKELNEKLMILNKERQSRKDNRIQKSMPDRANTVLSMQSERTEIKEILMDNNSDLRELQKQLLEKRSMRISQQLKSSKSRSGASSRLVSAGLGLADEIEIAERHYQQKREAQI
ncbi:Intraflagellar transport protein 80 [Boothiomyces sp. JEL0838]|nr:Intraflagellar transport protein 80 [Boothiomyces sp. JEL0838]